MRSQHAKGIGITNYHVLEGANSAQIKTLDGNHYLINNILSQSKKMDIIKFSIENEANKVFPFLKLCQSQPMEAEDVFVIGNPKELEKLLKYDYLFPKKIQNQTQLTNYMESFVIPDYNNKRPHGSLKGLTPLEAYRQKKVNFAKIRSDMIAAHKKRICYNQTHQCLGCPFGCKTKNKEP